MSEQDRDLQALLEQMAPRAEPPAAARARVLEAVEREWRAHKRRRWRVPLALAAALLIAAVSALLLTAPGPGIELQLTDGGGLWIDGRLEDSGGRLVLARNSAVEARDDTRLITGSGVEVRLRAGTRLTWREPEVVTLRHGAVYVATGGRGSLEIHTPMGVVRDIGTTFLVTLDGARLEVAMREGEVAIDTDFGAYQARAEGDSGDVVTVGSRRILAAAEPASAERWAWIHSVHPGYSERNVASLLAAIARDLGVGLEFTTPASRARARTLRLEGELGGVAPQEALDVVLATTDLVREPAPEGRLVIGIQSAGVRQ